MNSFGDRLKSSIKKSEYNQKELADKLDVHRNTLSQWVRNERHPDLRTLKELAHWLREDLSWLITGMTALELTVYKMQQKEMMDAIKEGREEYRVIDTERMTKIFSAITQLDLDKVELVENLVKQLSGGKS